ncbi:MULTISPECIES: DUF4062 domain-containing protein [unclassified Pseudomonas]|uniref:DUF4062 domain-containing protein n=1 Tax=unclassified Pseudomonas TaxID=196821 RepID=UPI0015BE5CB6|nr:MULTISPECIES: DUF4062 domain-containing protein [unclassified Pseudomonas]MBT1266836.1 DUF4062 domain-containing protein [Pseudomonas sp. VS38]NWC97347.1 DUF4062 domain-containing protein [Pseudomonas sp. P7779]
MDKRYQVFVSSTYLDLKDERQSVTQTLMEMDCIPAGMELFPAADEDQWTFIQRVIDDCDYYLLIVGGRYGSVSDEGISYTEKEFDYAVSKGLRVVALLHGNPDVLPLGKSEVAPEQRDRLSLFRTKISTGRVVKFWNDGAELPGLVALSLAKTIKLYPAQGWVRANEVSNEGLLLEINDLRKLNDSLMAQIQDLDSQVAPIFDIQDLAGVDDNFRLNGKYFNSYGSNSDWYVVFSWKEIFYYVSPYLVGGGDPSEIKRVLKEAACARYGVDLGISTLEDQDFQTVKVQLQALGLVNVELSDSRTKDGVWKLTNRGEKLMVELRAVRKE